VHINDPVAYKEAAQKPSQIAKRQWIIYPDWIRKGRPKKEGVRHECMECGESFLPLRRTAKFCSGKCQRKAKRRKTRMVTGVK
jgi:hypothetical protein